MHTPTAPSATTQSTPPPGPRKSPPARAPKRSPPSTPGSARSRSEAPVLTLGLPTATAIATVALAAPGCSPPTLAAAGAQAPAGLPRAPPSRLRPARARIPRASSRICSPAPPRPLYSSNMASRLDSTISCPETGVQREPRPQPSGRIRRVNRDPGQLIE